MLSNKQGQFGHHAVIDLPLSILWAHAGEQYTILFDQEFFQHALAFSGTSIMSTLREYETGQLRAHEFSHKNSQDDFKTIIGIIKDVWQSHAHSSRCQLLQENFKCLILALYVSGD